MLRIDVKDITVINFRIPSDPIDQCNAMQLEIENAHKTLPEVALVFSKNGNADLGTDPMPPNASDTYVIPKPEKEWPAEVKSKEDILRRIEERMKPLIDNRTEIQQPIQKIGRESRRARVCQYGWIQVVGGCLKTKT